MTTNLKRRGPGFSSPEIQERRKKIPQGTPLVERFWAQVEKRGPDECWLWIGALLESGHGQIYANRRMRKAHHIALELHGIDPYDGGSGKVVDHTCRVRKCVNPAHLRLVSRGQNGRENSVSPWAVNAARGACKRGHQWTPENTLRNSKGRQCRTCYEMRLRGEIQRQGPKPLGWVRKIRALPIGGYVKWPRSKDPAGVRKSVKERGMNITVRTIDSETLHLVRTQ